MIPFNLPQAKAGQVICTRSGRAVRILQTNVPRAYKHLLAQDETGYQYQVWPDGRMFLGKERPLDLMLIEGAFTDVPVGGFKITNEALSPPVTKPAPPALAWECPVCHAGVRADQTKCDHK